MSTIAPLGYIFASGCFMSGLVNAVFWDGYIVTHHLDGHLVLAAAVAGDCANDTLWFCIGRFGRQILLSRFGRQVLLKRISERLPALLRQRLTSAYKLAQRELRRNQWGFILLIKSPIGTVSAGPCICALGALQYSYLRFILLGAPMSVLWVLVYFGPFVFYRSGLLHAAPHLREALFVTAVTVPLGILGYTNQERIQALLLWIRQPR